MGGSRDGSARCRAISLARAAFFGAMVHGLTAVGVAQGPPAVVSHLETSSLVGAWYEVATTGTWWHRQCVTDTRYAFEAHGGGLRAASACSTRSGPARYRGRVRPARGGDGRLSIRFTPPIFNWLPATWSDFWVLATGPEQGWLLVGDNRRERLLVLSRTVALDEAAMAQALAAARREGYDPDRLRPVPHPAGATGLVPGAELSGSPGP